MVLGLVLAGIYQLFCQNIEVVNLSGWQVFDIHIIMIYIY